MSDAQLALRSTHGDAPIPGSRGRRGLPRRAMHDVWLPHTSPDPIHPVHPARQSPAAIEAHKRAGKAGNGTGAANLATRRRQRCGCCLSWCPRGTISCGHAARLIVAEDARDASARLTRNNHATHPVCATHAAMRDSTWEGVWEPGSPLGLCRTGHKPTSQATLLTHSLTHSRDV